MEEKIYSKGIYFKEVETKFGKIIKLSFNIQVFAEFCRTNMNDKGYINIDVLPRKEAGKFGDTHYGVLNTYKKEEKPKEETQISYNGESSDDIPF